MSTVPLISDAELLAMGIASNALGAISSPERDVARSTGSSMMLGYLQKRYKLPLITWSDDVKRATAHVVAYDLLVMRGFNPQAGADNQLETRYLAAIQWARDVARGLVIPESIVDSSPDVEEAAPLVSTDAGRWGNYGNR